MEKGEKRIAVIDKEICTREKCGYQCTKVCPVNRMGEKCVYIDEETQFPGIVESSCIGCGICVKKCPVKCITIINLSKELPPLTYSYGKNSFRLHGLALPKPSTLCGFVGKNGIGKTSAIKLLSGSLKPKNLELLPIEMREYFKNLKKGEISIKPQNIDKMRELDLTVKELLSKLKLHLQEFKNLEGRKLNELSGGELQLLAISIAMKKNAGIYFFDEISNFLDIRERLNTALELKKFSEGKTLIVAEHDLAVLDYLSDYIYVFYGEENAYGVVSSVKAVRNGINEYLDGFLEAENLRIRNYPIVFSTFSEQERKKESFLNYETMQIELNGFSLDIKEGEIRKGEIVGIVGRNGIGKTTFIKTLAGLVKPKKGTLSKKLKVAYKPQYISASESLVSEVFSSSSLNQSTLEKAKQYLDIKPSFLEKKLNQLSGGELQRISLALALSQNADIYLFDEPTAYLDIEQRVAFSELLRNFVLEHEKPVFVVDHDIVFIDRVSSRLVVFEGEPAKHGIANPPSEKEHGMNDFLKLVNITLRREKNTKRPRINKPESVLDREQKDSGNYFY